MQRSDEKSVTKKENKPKEYEGSMLFSALPREVLWLILIRLSLNDLINLESTSTGMHKNIRKAYDTKFTIWQSIQTNGHRIGSRENYINHCKIRFLKKHITVLEQANKVLSSQLEPTSSTPPIRVALFGNASMIKNLKPTGTLKTLLYMFKKEVLSLPSNINHNNYKIQIGHLYGINDELERRHEFNINAADIFVCFASDTTEFDAISNQFKKYEIHSFRDKIVILAHPADTKVLTAGKLKIHALYPLTNENRNEESLAAFCFNTLKHFADMYKNEHASIEALEHCRQERHSLDLTLNQRENPLFSLQ